MKLKKTYASADIIPAGYEGLFTEKDGAFTRDAIELEEAPADAKPKGDGSDEYRTRNRKLNNELGDARAELGRMKEQFSGVDADQFAKFQEQIAKIGEEEERNLIKQGNIDEVVKRRTARLLDEKNAELKARGEAYDTLKVDHTKLTERFASVQAGTSMNTLISAAGLRVRAGAQDDLASRIKQDWTVDSDGALVARRKDMIGDGGATMEPGEYVSRELLERRSFFFEPAKGGGAEGNSDQRTGGKKTISSGDPMNFGRNLEDIASGKTQVSGD